MPTIDFTEVQGLEPVDPGQYIADIVYAEEGLSKSNNPKIDVRWKISAGPQTDRQVFDTLSFHPSALWRTKQTLQSLGFPEDFSGDIEAEDLLNRTALITVKIEPGSGTDPATGEPYPDRNRITKVQPAPLNVDDFVS